MSEFISALPRRCEGHFPDSLRAFKAAARHLSCKAAVDGRRLPSIINSACWGPLRAAPFSAPSAIRRFLGATLASSRITLAGANRCIDLTVFAFAHLSLAAALAHLGRLDEARAAAKAGLELEPGFAVARFRACACRDNPAYLRGRERFYEGMRRASIPE